MGCVEAGDITKRVLDASDEFAARWPRSPYGPAHNVIDDQNVDDASIQWCLDNWGDDDPERADEYAATKAFLRDLLTWPIEEREG